MILHGESTESSHWVKITKGIFWNDYYAKRKLQQLSILTHSADAKSFRGTACMIIIVKDCWYCIKLASSILFHYPNYLKIKKYTYFVNFLATMFQNISIGNFQTSCSCGCCCCCWSSSSPLNSFSMYICINIFFLLGDERRRKDETDREINTNSQKGK